MNNDLLKLILDTKDSMINGFSRISDDTIYGYVSSIHSAHAFMGCAGAVPRRKRPKQS